MGRLAATQSRAATGGRDDWRTPAALLEAIELRWRIWLAVDAACSSDNMVFTAAKGFALDRGEDGLDLDWHSATIHDGEWVWVKRGGRSHRPKSTWQCRYLGPY